MGRIERLENIVKRSQSLEGGDEVESNGKLQREGKEKLYRTEAMIE